MCGGSHKETAVAVSSVLFNIAGPVEKRRAFLPTQTAGAVVSSAESIPDNVQKALANGSGFNLRSFARWARTSDYRNVIGTPSAKLSTTKLIDNNQLTVIIQNDVGGMINLLQARVENDSIGYWVLKHVLTNYPDRANSGYGYFYDVNTSMATVTWTDNTTVSFAIPTPEPDSQYLVALFARPSTLNTVAAAETIPYTEIPEGEYFPSYLLSWVDGTKTSTNKTATLNTTETVTITYSDGRPDEVTTQTVTTTENYVEESIPRTFNGQQPTGTTITGVPLFNWFQASYTTLESWKVKTDEEETVEVELIDGGTVTKTTTTVMETDSLVRLYAYSGSRTVVEPVRWAGYELWEYKFGSGRPEVDALLNAGKLQGEYLPFIPVRIAKQFISDSYASTLLPSVNRATRRAFKSRYRKLEQGLRDNESIADVDYAYVVFGAPINTKVPEVKEYIFQFLSELYTNYTEDNPTTFEEFQAQWDAAYASQQKLQLWYDQNIWSGSYEDISTVPYPSGATFRLDVQSNNMTVLNYDQTIEGHIASLQAGAGLAWSGAKAGDIQIVPVSKEDLPDPFFAKSYDTLNDPNAMANDGAWLGVSDTVYEWTNAVHSAMAVTKQVTSNSWQRIVVKDFFFRDRIYKGDYNKGSPEIVYSVADAFADADESGFLLPLNEAIIRQMSLKDATDLAANSGFVLCNAYKTETYKVKSGGFFAIIVAIVVVIIAVVVSVFMPALAPSMYAAASATGTALGLTGTAAIVAGAAVNAIAGMVISMIITNVATGIFGDKVGAIVGAVASFIALNVAGAAMSGTQNMFASAQTLFSAENVLGFTAAVGKGWKGYNEAIAIEIQEEIIQVGKDTVAMQSDYEGRMKQVNEMFSQLFGTNTTGALNTLALTDAFHAEPDTRESSSLFLERTLLTGSDVANITNSYVTSFTQFSLTLDPAINGV